MKTTLSPGMVKMVRESLGMTHHVLGDILGVSQSTVYRWERDDLITGSQRVAMPPVAKRFLTAMYQYLKLAPKNGFVAGRHLAVFKAYEGFGAMEALVQWGLVIQRPLEKGKLSESDEVKSKDEAPKE